RNDAKHRSGPKSAIRLDLRNQSESDDVADGAADQQNACPAGTRRLIQLRLNGNFGTARDGREALFTTQLSNAVVRVQRTKGDSHTQNHCHQSDQFSAHPLLLLPSIDAPRGRVLWSPPAL